MTQDIDANFKVIRRDIRILDNAKYGSIPEKQLAGYQTLIDSVSERIIHSKSGKINEFLLDEFQAMICYMRGDNAGANKHLIKAIANKGSDKKFVSQAARQWEIDYTNKLLHENTQHAKSMAAEHSNAKAPSVTPYISTHKKSTDYSWVGWLFGIGIFIFIFYGLSSPSDTSKTQTKEDNSSIIYDFVDEIDRQYSGLVDSTTRLAQDIDEECVWLADNISQGVGDYCGDVANNNYAFLQGGGWSIGSLTYSVDGDLNETLDDIADQANHAYNSLLKVAQETEDAIHQQCSWLEDNISYSVGEGCYASINGLDDFSSSPFDASKYHKED